MPGRGATGTCRAREVGPPHASALVPCRHKAWAPAPWRLPAWQGGQLGQWRRVARGGKGVANAHGYMLRLPVGLALGCATAPHQLLRPGVARERHPVSAGRVWLELRRRRPQLLLQRAQRGRKLGPPRYQRVVPSLRRGGRQAGEGCERGARHGPADLTGKQAGVLSPGGRPARSTAQHAGNSERTVACLAAEGSDPGLEGSGSRDSGALTSISQPEGRGAAGQSAPG